MRRRLAIALALTATLAYPTAALADQTVTAVDGVALDGSDNRWSPNAVTVKVGEQVTWSFAGTSVPHNVTSQGTNWSIHSDLGVALPPVSTTFTTPGTYEFFCQFHPTPMRGTITVTDETGAPPPPPPPPPLSEQPFANEQAAPTALELLDKKAPQLTGVDLGRITHGARIRFRLSEAARVTIKLTRGRSAKTRTVNARKGATTVTVKGLRAGHYRVELRARDLSGNRSSAKRANLTIR